MGFMKNAIEIKKTSRNTNISKTRKIKRYVELFLRTHAIRNAEGNISRKNNKNARIAQRSHKRNETVNYADRKEHTEEPMGSGRNT